MNPVVLLHGIGGAIWGPTLPALAPARVIAHDLPGYGGTPMLPETNFPTLARALRERLAEQGIGRVDLLGHSFGGMLSLEFAALFPDRVGRLVLYGTTPAFGGRDPAFAETFLAERLAPLDQGTSMRALAEGSMPSLLGPGAPASAATAVVEAMAAVPAEAYRAILTCLTTFDRRAALAAITAPTLLLAGEDDRLAPVPTMLRMSLAIPGSRLRVLPRAGHLAHLQAPERFNDAVRAFLREAAA